MLVLQLGQKPASFFLPIQQICEAELGRQSLEPDSMLFNWDQYMSAESSI